MDSYLNKHNQHEVYLGRLATHLLNEYSYPSLELGYKSARLILLDSEEITSMTKLNKITAKVAADVSSIINDSWDKITPELNETAVYEASYYQSMFSVTNAVELAVVTDKKVISAVGNALMTLHSGSRVKSDVWSNYTKQNTASVVDTFNAQIKSGYSNDETLSQIVKRLKTVSGGILKNDAEALVRTGMSHYATNSREALMQANKDLVPNKYFNSVFDNRRTLICAGYAENPVYAIDDPKAPVFPLHFNERSNWLYLTKGQSEPQGTRSAVGGKKSIEAEESYNKRKAALDKRRNNENITGKTSSKVKYRGRKDSETFKAGQIKGSTSSDEWLRSNPRWFIESSLGKKRASMFIDGKVSMEKFTDMTGRVLTLNELKALGI